MAVVTSRTELKDYALRKIGAPVIEINIDDDQIEDRIDDALELFYLHHYDGTEKQYISHAITQIDIDQEYISIPDTVQNIIKVYQTRGGPLSTGGIFSEEFQFHLNNIEVFTGGTILSGQNFGLIDYTVMESYLNLVSDTTSAEKQFFFNKTTDQLHILHNWENQFEVDEFIVMESWVRIDPEANTEVYNDRWLKEYVTELVKRQWADNLSKFENVQLPSGITLNAATLWERANAKIQELEEKMITDWSLPIDDVVA